MRINFCTLFPERIQSYFSTGLPGKAVERKVIEITTIQMRDFSGNKHNKVDDIIYGGGPGMLLQVGPVFRSLESLGDQKGYVVLLSPSGVSFDQGMAIEFSQMNQPLTLVSGYYEGFDHRIVEYCIDREVSIGNFVLSAGDLPALCIADSVSRLLPGFMGESDSLSDESHNQMGVLEYPQYTRPRDFNGWKVPEVLVGGNHEEIRLWREANRKKQDN